MRTYIKNVATHPELRYLSSGVVSPEYSRQAMMRAVEKGIRLPSTFDTNGKVVECEYYGSALVKVVVRIPHSKQWDLVLVLIRGNFVKTVWLNHVRDHHATLDMGRVG